MARNQIQGKNGNILEPNSDGSVNVSQKGSFVEEKLYPDITVTAGNLIYMEALSDFINFNAFNFLVKEKDGVPHNFTIYALAQDIDYGANYETKLKSVTGNDELNLYFSDFIFTQFLFQIRNQDTTDHIYNAKIMRRV